MKIKQTFVLPVKFYKNGKEQTVREREWSLEDLGSKQIEHVWRHYRKDIWVSNIGYVAQINAENAQKRFAGEAKKRCDEFIENYKESGLVFRKLSYDERLLLKVCTFVPRDSGAVNSCGDKAYGVELYVDRVKEPLHTIIAKVFLGKKQGDGLVVHHIDNNSYNNSVTNLICIDGALHGVNTPAFKKLHPYSPGKTSAKPGRAKDLPAACTTIRQTEERR